MAANNLSELFSQKLFRIPDYQRGYAWGEKQLSEMWDDLDEILPLGNGELKKHYTGTIYLEDGNPNDEEKWLSGAKFYNVVDGQQRLTTISILLFELLKVANNGYCEESKEDLIKKFCVKSNSSGESRVYKFSYLPSNKNYQFLQNSIFEDSKTILQNNYQNNYTKNLSSAKTFFQEKISKISNEQRELLFKKVTTSLQFDIRIIEKDLDVQAVFETMNNRGKPLSILEKLKNRLIYLNEKLIKNKEDKESLREKINDAWGKIYTSLAKNPNQILDEDVFLSAHLSLYREPKDATFSEKLAEEKVFQMFCNKSEKYELDENGAKEAPVTFKKIEDYILGLSELAPIWYEIHNSSSKTIKKILLMNNGKELKVFLMSILNKPKEEDLKEIVFLNLEKIMFRNRVPGIHIMDERNTVKWARDIYNNKENISKIISIQQNLINKEINVENIIQSFRHLFTYEYKPKGFHKWGNLKYFLFEYENELKLKAKETNDKVTLDHFSETTIEHIIPQEFRNNWQTEVSEVTSKCSEKNKGQLEKVLLNTLGNLTILKNGKNSSLGNKSWKEKKERFRTGSYNEIDISKSNDWTSKNISERGIEMLKFLQKKIGGLTFTDEEMNRILYYDQYIIEILNPPAR